MTPHLLWVDVRDAAEEKTILRAHSFFGHPSLASSLYVPLMDGAYLCTPKGERINLEMKKGDWLAGYGHSAFLFTDIMLFWPGDYIFFVARSPGVYDLGWHGGKSNPFLSYNFAKAVIHAGDGPAGNLDAGLPLEMISEHAPYRLKEGEDLNIQVKYLGKPVKASYNASYWTWDEHGDPRVQRGETKEDGKFNVNLSQSGLWFINVGYSLPEAGIWKATHSLGHFFNSGDMIQYNNTRYKTTLSVWVR
ncbi:MAG: DUF4198 domain-containing protein [Euryarchaeota archaeon]|nr:DUF4198 domain-containing protein [Euryarchaeota archaeon]